MPWNSVTTELDKNFAAVWKTLGTVDGKVYGVPFKGANKSTVWYSVSAFKNAGVTVKGALAGGAVPPSVCVLLVAQGAQPGRRGRGRPQVRRERLREARHPGAELITLTAPR